MVVGGGGLGAPGTKIVKQQNEKSELWIYIKQAVFGAIAFDVMIGLVLALLLCIGWPALFLVWAGASWLIALVCRYAVADILARRRLIRAFAISLFVSFAVFAPTWWQALTCRGVFLDLLRQVVKPLCLPYWAYGGLLVMWFIGALKGRGKLVAAFIGACLLLLVVYSAGFGGVDWQPMIVRLRYITPVFLLSPILFSGVLGVVMLKEMLLPNLDVTLTPFKYAEWVEAGGLFGVLIPKLKRAVPMPRIRITESSRDGLQQRICDLPNDEQCRAFYQSVLNGSPFSYQTAKMNRVRFNSLIRDPFLERDLAVWKSPSSRQQGLELTEKGKRWLTGILTGKPLEDWEDD